MAIRVALVDDHVVLRQGLRMLLETEPDITVVAEAGDGSAAVEEVIQHEPDVVLMGLNTPNQDGLSAVRSLHEQEPRARVVMYSNAQEDDAVVAAVRAGAIGFVSKAAPLDVLLRTLRSAAAGEVALSAAASARLVEEFHHPVDQVESLTNRELEVIELLAQGLSNKEIAWRLCISEKTIKSHVSTILSKFGLVSRTQAALYAMRVGLVPAERRGPAVSNVVVLDSQRRARYGRAQQSAARAIS